MARNKDLARLPRNPKISAVLVWEKDKEGKSGRLVFSDIQYEPIIIEVDELKRMHKPLIRIVYYRDGQEVAYAILPKDIGPLNAQNVMGCIDVRLGEVRSYHSAPDVFKMIFYKALAFVKSDNFGVQLQHGNYQSAAAEISLWAENVYKAHGVNHDETAIYDIATGRLSPVRTGSDSLTIDDLRRRFPISYRQVIMTPGSLHGLDTHDTILYCLACKVSLDDIAFFVSLPKAKVREIIGESLLGEKKTRPLDENESKLYPIGTIFVTERPMPLDVRIIRFWQVIRCTERTLWVQEVHADQAVPSDRDRFPVRDMPVNNTIHMCRINLKAHRETPIHIDGELATVWAGKVLTKDRLWSYRS